MDRVHCVIRDWPGREAPATITANVHETNTRSLRVNSASDHQHSELLRRVVSHDANDRMPPKGERAGDILLADSTIFTTLFGGDESLDRFWKNIATK